MGPLTQNLGLAPEVMVCVLSGACALINGITPTSGVLMGGISISRIEFSTWVKYIWKVLLAMLLVHVVILSVALVIFYKASYLSPSAKFLPHMEKQALYAKPCVQRLFFCFCTVLCTACRAGRKRDARRLAYSAHALRKSPAAVAKARPLLYA